METVIVSNAGKRFNNSVLFEIIFLEFPMRFATFNLENMFQRPALFQLEEERETILKDFEVMNTLITNVEYTEDVKEQLEAFAKKYEGLAENTNKYITLQCVRDKLFGAKGELKAKGRADWSGWFELRKETVNAVAVENTARIVSLLKADILCTVEVESRPALVQLSKDVLPVVRGVPFDQAMLIDGNDPRGIDVGILLSKGFRIESMQSHVYDQDNLGIIFSRDCAEYFVSGPNGLQILVLINHFKSKGYGDQKRSLEKRFRQAKRVRTIVDERIKQGFKHIVVAGDLNDTPDSPALSPLLKEDTPLQDVMQHPKFKSDGRVGTHGNGNQQIDYILMTKELWSAVRDAGVERRGVWGGKNGDLFPHLDTITTSEEAASDHAALWVEFDPSRILSKVQSKI
jgi:endonuclease/exonuclease/phosphatase family metal-dependent hydrolase